MWIIGFWVMMLRYVLYTDNDASEQRVAIVAVVITCGKVETCDLYCGNLGRVAAFNKEVGHRHPSDIHAFEVGTT